MKKFKRFDIFIYVLIIANILAMVLESHVSIKLEYENIFYYFELISISIFLLNISLGYTLTIKNLNGMVLKDMYLVFLELSI